MEDGTGYIDARVWYNNEDPDVVRERHAFTWVAPILV
jgi:hypothetical protein